MDGFVFRRLIQELYEPILVPRGFHLLPLRISGREYAAKFESKTCSLTVAFEPGDDYSYIEIENAGQGSIRFERSMSNLKSAYVSRIGEAELAKADAFVSNSRPTDPTAKTFVDFARDLYLVLPFYLDEIKG